MGNPDVKKCTSCGKDIQIDAVFCTNCGTRFEEKRIEVKKCASCGQDEQIDAQFCTHCGARFEEHAAARQVNATVKTCSSCGKEMDRDAVFCTNCGARFEDRNTVEIDTVSYSSPRPEAEEFQRSPVGSQFLNLANDLLSVREINPTRFEFSSRTGARSPGIKMKVSYDAIAQLEPDKKQVTFWEKMVESSSGMDSGFYSEKTFQKGTEVTKQVHGHLLFGGKYGFEYGKLREVVKTIAAEQGWTFKLAIFKPKG